MSETERPTTEALERELSSAVAAKAERDSLVRRSAAAQRQCAAADTVLTGTAAALASESADVAKLESLSFTRVLASLRGDRASALDAERAEQKRAEYAHAVAVATRDAAFAERQRLRLALSKAAEVDRRYAAALAAKEAWLLAGPPDERARELAESAERRGRLEALERETTEAIAAGSAALQSLSQARTTLSSANTWANIDVFAGGGLLVDSLKRSRMDEAAGQLHAAETALLRFGSELADINASIEALQLNLTMSVLDIAFDNVFTDLAVRGRIGDASHRADQAHQAVDRKVSELKDELRRVQAERGQLDDRRTALLCRD
ncbi:MAG TPA: hypothetical protein VLL08_04275 [Kineosporiaceae bacterium]|nr:hypothetical protein [Kineosporiaceae bacterium]